MKRTLLALGVSAMLAMPYLATAQMAPAAPGSGSSPGTGGSSYGSRMEQQERRGQTDVQPADVRRAQERLKEAGFNPGPTDGQLGAQTKDALKEYQKAHGLPPTGQLDEPTRELLMVQRPQGAPGQMHTPGGYTGEGTRPGESMPGGRTPGQPGSSSGLQGSSSSSR